LHFIVDGMLGKLTRWLRMLGHDVKYSTHLSDSELLAVAKKERRVLLTRDLELFQRATARGVEAFYSEGQTEGKRLGELAKKYALKLEIDMATSRCSKCNTRVKPIPKDKVKGKVEKNTFEHYDAFWKCPKCGQIYWQGAHWARIGETLEAANKSLKT
jgi:uncharacterized protein with PIN domain